MKRHTQSQQEGREEPVHKDGAVVLEETEGLFHSLQEDDLQQRSEAWVLLVLMRAAGRRDVDYAGVMATSGWAGQFVYNPKPDWPSFVPPGRTVEKACAAYGFEVVTLTPDSIEEAFEFIRESVDAGRAVQANYYEDGIFSGYAEASESDERRVRFLSIPFAADGEWWTMQELREKWWDGQFVKILFRLGRATEPKEPRENALDVMKDLVRLAATDYWQNAQAPGALTGFTALERYAEDIADVIKTMQDNRETNKETCFFDRGWGCYAVYPQWTARECSARSLERAVQLFDEPVASRVGEASRHYHMAYAHWRDWGQQLGRVTEPGSYDEHWADPARRAAGSAAVRQAVASERSAIAAVQEALALLD